MNSPQDTLALIQSLPMFHNIPAESLAPLAKCLDWKTIPERRDVFREGEPGRSFYLIVSGSVSLWRNRGREEAQSALLGAGDPFGEEILLGDASRRFTAYTETETQTLCASAESIREIAVEIPLALATLRAVHHARNLVWGVRFPWLMPEETVYIATRKAGALLAPDLLVPGLIALGSTAAIPLIAMQGWPGWLEWIAAAGITAGLAYGAWQAMDWSNDFYLVTNRRVVALRRVPLISDDRQETPLGMVQSVSVSRSVEQRALGFGNVDIRTFTKPIVLESVPDPETIARIIEGIWKRTQSRESKIDREEIQQILSERIHRKKDGSEPLPVEAAQETDISVSTDSPPAERTFGGIQSRWETGDTVTYRKHPFFLVRNVFLPLLLVLAGVITDIVAADGYFPIPAPIGLIAGIAVSITGILWAVYEYLDWSNDLYRVTGDQILAVHRHPLGDEERRSAALENILSLEYDRPSFLARLMNFGTVAATVGQVNFTFDEIRDPVGVQEDIFRRMEARKLRREESLRGQRRNEIADWIETYHEMTQDREDPSERKS